MCLPPDEADEDGQEEDAEEDGGPPAPPNPPPRPPRSFWNSVCESKRAKRDMIRAIIEDLQFHCLKTFSSVCMWIEVQAIARIKCNLFQTYLQQS